VRRAFAALSKRCPGCSSLIPYEKRRYDHCSQSCATTAYQRSNPQPTKRSACGFCGEPCSRPGNIYCSTRCTGLASAAKTSKTLETAMATTGVLVGSVNVVKRFLLKQRGHSCSICGLSRWNFMGNDVLIPLVLDHENGNSDDWRVKNLRLVCGICDMLLPTYKGKNRGHGRFSRRQRYTDGKSH